MLCGKHKLEKIRGIFCVAIVSLHLNIVQKNSSLPAILLFVLPCVGTQETARDDGFKQSFM